MRERRRQFWPYAVTVFLIWVSWAMYWMPTTTPNLAWKYLASPIVATVALLTVLGWWLGVRLRVRVAIHLKD